MSDAELIARLRDAPADGLGTENLCLEAADRIEALIAERDEANKRGDAWRFRADIAEVKLAKAVEALDKTASGVFSGQLLMSMPPKDAAAEYARATLAEIKGESHEQP